MTDNKFKGIVTKGVGGLYEVRPLPRLENTGEKYECRARGVFRHDKISPMPGDIVTVTPENHDQNGDNTGVIDSIDERKNSLIRPALANLTHLFAVIPAARPAPDLLTADKLICTAESKSIEPVIVVTKTDLDLQNAKKITEAYSMGGFRTFAVQADGSTDSTLMDYIVSEAASGTVTAAFAGASGAGKSTLMARLFPDLRLKTGEVSPKIQRGRHTTRHNELFPVTVGEAECYIADTPGFSMIDYTRFNFVKEAELANTFREFETLLGKCRYTKCTHTKEEGCAVLEKVKSGEISAQRHQSYCAILEEIRKNPPWKRKNM